MDRIGYLSNSEPFTLPDKSRHVYICGKSGTGKSTLLFNLMQADHSFALLDPHGDLAEFVANSVPKHRTNDVLYIDPADLTHSVAFNPLQGVEPDNRALVASHLVAAFKSVWSNSWGPRLEYILLNSLRLLLDTPNTTLLGLPRLLVDDRYRTSLLGQCTDPVIQSFWVNEFDRYPERLKAEAIAPLQNKIGALLSSPPIRHILCQGHSTINVPYLMDNGKILIANLSKGRLGDEPSHLLGAFLVTAIFQAAEARATIPEEERQPFTLYADEFQNFANDSFATILSEARKWRLSLVLANQFIGQLPDFLKASVLGNAGTIVSFRIGTEDASILGEELQINPNALIDLPNYHAWVKLSVNSVPVSRYLETVPPDPVASGRLPVIRSRCHARHARPRGIVEEAIQRFYGREL